MFPFHDQNTCISIEHGSQLPLLSYSNVLDYTKFHALYNISNLYMIIFFYLILLRYRIVKYNLNIYFGDWSCIGSRDEFEKEYILYIHTMTIISLVFDCFSNFFLTSNIKVLVWSRKIKYNIILIIE